MRLLAITNLYPWPTQPTRGMYNAQLFRAIERELQGDRGTPAPFRGEASPPIGGGGAQCSVFSVQCSEGWPQRGARDTKGASQSAVCSLQSAVSPSPPDCNAVTLQRCNDSDLRPPISPPPEGGEASPPTGAGDLRLLVLVPEWRFWRWPAIRRWPVQTEDRRPKTEDHRPQTSDLRPQTIDHRPQTIDPSCHPDSPSCHPDSPSCHPERSEGSPTPTPPHSHTPTPTTYLPVFYLPLFGRGVAHVFYWLSAGGALTRAAAQADVVYGSWLYPDAVVAARAARRAGKRFFLRVHGSDVFHLEHPARARSILRTLRQADGVIGNSRPLCDRMREAGVPTSRILYAPNGVDTESFRYRSREEGRERLQTSDLRLQTEDCRLKTADTRHPTPDTRQKCPMRPPPDAPWVIFVGNLVEVKRPGLLLDAFAAVGPASPKPRPVPAGRQVGVGVCACRSPGAGSEERVQGSGLSIQTTDHRPQTTDLQTPPLPSPHLILLGAGPLKERLERQAAELGIAERVHVMGSRPHAEIALWMNAADCLCLCSRSEGMPNVVRESLASGLPVVATDVGACAELLAGEPCCRLVKSGDAPALSDALAATLAQVCDRSALAARHSHHSWRDQAKLILEFMGGGGV